MRVNCSNISLQGAQGSNTFENKFYWWYIQPMGRPLKNSDHPLARLRTQLSTSHQMTRAELSKKTGVPEASLKDIELGKYKLTKGIAIKISLATGVSAESLMEGDDPLLDICARPVSKESLRWDYLASAPLYQEARKQLCEAAWECALKRRVGLLMWYSFENWLAKTVRTFGLEALLAEKLTERLGLFDPQEMPSKFRPKKKHLAVQWKRFEEQMKRFVAQLENEEDQRRLLQNQPDPPVVMSPNLSQSEIRQMFLEMGIEYETRLRREACHKTRDSLKLSGKRVRSPDRTGGLIDG